MRTARGRYPGTRQRFSTALNSVRPHRAHRRPPALIYSTPTGIGLCVSSHPRTTTTLWTWYFVSSRHLLVHFLYQKRPCAYCYPYDCWPPLDRYNGKANSPHSALHLARIWFLNPCKLRSPISFPSCLCSFSCLHCTFGLCSPHSPSFHHNNLAFRAPVFSGLCRYCYWVGPLPFIPRVARLNFPLQSMSRDSGVPIHHISITIFWTFPPPVSRHSPHSFTVVSHLLLPLVTSITFTHVRWVWRSVPDGQFSLPPQSITAYCFIVALTALSPALAYSTHKSSIELAHPLSATRRHPIPSTIVTIFYILYRPSPPTLRILLFLVSFEFELCKMWMLPFFSLYQWSLSSVHFPFSRATFSARVYS